MSGSSFSQQWKRFLLYTGLVYDFHGGAKALGRGRLFRAAKFFIRTLLWWRSTNAWLDVLDRPPLRDAADPIRKDLCEKIHRPYARLSYTVADRARVLIEHYSFLIPVLPAPVLAALLAEERLLFARLAGRNEGESFSVVLTRTRRLHHQGELLIIFVDDATTAMLMTFALNILRDEAGEAVLFISSLKGPSPPDGMPEIARATRSLAGLRPKRAVLEAAYALAEALGIKKIVAVAKTNHVLYTEKRLKRNLDIHADYDGFWNEFEPETQPDGDYRLPAALARRSPEEVPSKRRKDWLRRQAYLDLIRAGAPVALFGAPREG